MSDRASHIASYRAAVEHYYADLSAVISNAINADFAAKNPEAKDKIAVVAESSYTMSGYTQLGISAENGGTEKFWEYLKPLEQEGGWNLRSGNQISLLFPNVVSMLKEINSLLGDDHKISVPGMPSFMNAGVQR